MAFEQKPNSGTLFENDRKLKSVHPDFKGQALIDGKEYWISAWNNDEPGKKFRISIAFELKQAAGTERPVTTTRREVPIRTQEDARPPIDPKDEPPF